MGGRQGLFGCRGEISPERNPLTCENDYGCGLSDGYHKLMALNLRESNLRFRKEVADTLACQKVRESTLVKDVE